jgi:hypothetical protein
VQGLPVVDAGEELDAGPVDSEVRDVSLVVKVAGAAVAVPGRHQGEHEGVVKDRRGHRAALHVAKDSDVRPVELIGDRVGGEQEALAASLGVVLALAELNQG